MPPNCPNNRGHFCVLLSDQELSLTDIVDVLVEDEVYRDLDFAREGVQNVWTELQRRQSWIGDSAPFTINSSWIRLRNTQWKDEPAYTFIILLSLAGYYDWWKEASYNEQGALFEQLTMESLKAQFSDWSIYQTGWTKKNPAGLEKVVNEVTERLGVSKGDLDLWNTPNAKERGLDLLWYRPFPDNRIGFPVYLVQCASGGNWDSKLETPSLNEWLSMVNFKTDPKRAFSIPFALQDEEFIRSCDKNKGVLLDRCRLLNASRYNEDWVSESLKKSIVEWSESRVATLLNKSM